MNAKGTDRSRGAKILLAGRFGEESHGKMSVAIQEMKLTIDNSWPFTGSRSVGYKKGPSFEGIVCRLSSPS
jgi:hypothetical protein